MAAVNVYIFSELYRIQNIEFKNNYSERGLRTVKKTSFLRSALFGFGAISVTTHAS